MQAESTPSIPHQSQTPSFSREEMEQILPDYLFCQLSEAESSRFEQSLPYFPELEQELQQARTVFAQMKSQDLYERRTQRVRNLSVKIQERRYAEMERKQVSLRSFRFAAPVIVLGVLALFIVFPQFRSFNSLTNNPLLEQERSALQLSEPQWSSELQMALASNAQEVTADHIVQVVSVPEAEELEFVTDGVLLLDLTTAQALSEGMVTVSSSVFAETFAGNESVGALQEDDVQYLFSKLDRKKQK